MTQVHRNWQCLYADKMCFSECETYVGPDPLISVRACGCVAEFTAHISRMFAFVYTHTNAKNVLALNIYMTISMTYITSCMYNSPQSTNVNILRCTAKWVRTAAAYRSRTL